MLLMLVNVQLNLSYNNKVLLGDFWSFGDLIIRDWAKAF
jgi:hypothetical protein